MKSRTVLMIGFMLSFFGAIMTFSQSLDVPRSLVRFTENELVAFGKDPVIIEAVERQNAEGLSLDLIKERDLRWRTTPGINTFMESLMNNACARKLKDFEARHRYILETFVMDNQGANVGQSNKTSDYWQGDEDKFIKSFNNGSGTIFYGSVEWDESAKANIVQISIPVIKGGQTIGAITFGISIEEWEKR